MTSFLVMPPVETLHDFVAVLGVDLEQRQQDEAERAALIGRLRLHAFPQVGVDAPQVVAAHSAVSCRTKTGAETQLMIGAPSRDDRVIA